MERSEKLVIIGLGNPGDEYTGTIHNAGRMFVEFMAQTYGLTFAANKKVNCDIAENEQILLIAPRTFMNDSGTSVRSIVDYFKLPVSRLMVAHDDTDIPLGSFKIQSDRASAGHNGVQSVIDHLGTQDFWRIRIGARPEHETRKAMDFVLKPVSNTSRELLMATFEAIKNRLRTID